MSKLKDRLEVILKLYMPNKKWTNCIKMCSSGYVYIYKESQPPGCYKSAQRIRKLANMENSRDEKFICMSAEFK